MPRAPKVNLTEYETKSGPRWKLRWHAEGRDQEERGFTDEDRAKLRRNEIENELLRGAAPLSTLGRQRLSDFAEYHFTTATWLKPTTKLSYRKLTKLNINAALVHTDPVNKRRKTICLGQMQLKAITPEIVEQWVQAVEQNRGPLQRAKAYRCLSGVMSRALKDKQILSHPCQVRGASEEAERERPYVEDDVPWRLAQALKNYRDRYGRRSRDRYAAIPIVVGYGTGNRKSEVRGLRRRDIHLGTNEALIDVKRQAHYIDAENGWDTDAPTKSKAGKRPIWIQEAALDALRAHMDTYMRPEEGDPEGDDLVFTGPRGGPISDSSWDLAWRQARIDAGVNPDLHLHDLRHLAATSLAEGVKDLKYIQRFLGDSTLGAAMRYLDVTDDNLKESGRVMGRRFAHFKATGTDDNVVPIQRAQ
jgi:integrase